jgi:hypothetical protein
MKELSLLPLLNAALVTDLIVISLFLLGVLPSVSLGRWYKSFHLGAVIMDVLVLALVVLLAHYLYPFVFGSVYSIWKFGALAVGIQLVHDLLFAGFFYQFQKGSSRLVDILQSYMSEQGTKVLVADALMILSTVGFERLFSGALTGIQQSILAIILVYVTPYLVFSV